VQAEGVRCVVAIDYAAIRILLKYLGVKDEEQHHDHVAMHRAKPPHHLKHSIVKL
jgi:hypothetical protein